jgi:ligand-binding sensor protein
MTANARPVKEEDCAMTPLDVNSKEEWEKILDGFARDTNMTACLADKDGGVLFCRMARYPLCAAVRENPDATTAICSQTNMAMLAEVRQTKKPEVDMCDVGLFRIVVPVLHDGEMIGQVTACGVASEDEEVDTFRVSKELDISEEKAEDLLRSTPFGSEEELENLAARLFDQLSSK